jgi:hypothetical protein
MGFVNDIDEIMNYAHYWNWIPDWDVVKDIYSKIPNSYSVLTPFAYTYLEEMIRSTTSEYGIEVYDASGKPKVRRVGRKLIELAIRENDENQEYVNLLVEIKNYFAKSQIINHGDNRNSVAHGYMHPRFWSKESFEKLIHDIAMLSKHAKF